MICELCKNILNVKGFKHHLKTKHNLINENLNKIYWDLLIRVDIQNKIINDYLSGYAIIDLNRKFTLTTKMIYNFLVYKKIKLRSASESKKTQQYNEKYINTLKEKYGVDNVSKLNEVKIKKTETMMKNYGRRNQFDDDKIRNFAKSKIDYITLTQKTKQTILRKYGVENIAQIPYVREGTSKRMKEMAKNILTSDKINNFWKKIKFASSLEKRIHSVLFDLGVNYENNIWVSGYSIDILLKSYNLIIEVNGDYWHANPLIYHEKDVILHRKGKPILAGDIWNKDEKKKQLIIKSGYNFEVVWEKEIKTKNVIELKELVENILKKYEN